MASDLEPQVYESRFDQGRWRQLPPIALVTYKLKPPIHSGGVKEMMAVDSGLSVEEDGKQQ